MDASKKIHNRIDPLAITESLGFQTFRRATRKPWSKDEDNKLVQTINEVTNGDQKMIDPDQIKWDVVASKVFPSGSRKPKDCRKRWCNSLNPLLKKGKWTKDEDEQLLNAYKKHGASWQKVASDIPGRTDDQCAKRYIEVLDPKTKDRLKPWTHEEDLNLVHQVREHGTKWRTIALKIKGRPSLTCRNRWRKLVTDVVRGKADPLISREVTFVTQRNANISDDTNNEGSLSVDLGTSFSNSGAQSDSSSYQGSLGAVRKPEHESLPMVNERRYQTPSGIHRQAESSVQWKYQISGNSSEKLPHEKLFNSENQGDIKTKELAQYLISYAKTYDLDITVHQHIHHHYFPQHISSQAPRSQHNHDTQNHHFANSTTKSSKRRSFGFEGITDPSYVDTLSSKDNISYLRPENQLTRYQHFNYLPPLAEVPKLTSSVSPPNSYMNTSNNLGYQKYNSNSELELNERDAKRFKVYPSTEGSDSGPMFSRKVTPESNTLTPLTQAVEAVAAAEAHGQPLMYGLSALNDVSHEVVHSPAGSTSSEMGDEDLEEGMDFWETMRHLTDISSLSNSNKSNNHYRNIAEKPVSKHHPLHNSQSVSTKVTKPLSHLRKEQYIERKDLPLEDNEEEDDEEEAVGLFYNVYTKEPSAAPLKSVESNKSLNGSTYEGLVSVFDMIPFNPS